jgi:hypothetical protein
MLAAAAFFSLSLLWCSWLAANGKDLRNCKTQGEAVIAANDKPQGSPGDLIVDDGIQVMHTDDKGIPVVHQISILGLKVP